MEYLKEKLNYYFNYNIKTDEDSYIFDIKSEDEILQRKVFFDHDIKKQIISQDDGILNSSYNYKYFITVYVSILFLTIKIIYQKLLYK